jgi:hypothetical protein
MESPVVPAYFSFETNDLILIKCSTELYITICKANLIFVPIDHNMTNVLYKVHI